MRKEMAITVIWLATFYFPAITQTGQNQKPVDIKTALLVQPLTRSSVSHYFLTQKMDNNSSEIKDLTEFAQKMGVPQEVIETILWFYEANQTIQKVKETKVTVYKDTWLYLYLAAARQQSSQGGGKNICTLTAEFK